MMLYKRAEREADFALNLYANRKIISYFFAAGHWFYARDGTVHVNTMENLPLNILEAFMKGDHVGRHKEGIWNGLWSDMMIETTYMLQGKGPGGLIGISTSQRSSSIWANSHHTIGEIVSELDIMSNHHNVKSTVHKEESTAQIKADASDRKKIRTMISKSFEWPRLKYSSQHIQ